MQLTRATKENGLFNELEIQWRGQLAQYEETLEDYMPSYIEHCNKVLIDTPDDYFVYVMTNSGAYEGFLHINRAKIKKFSGYTLRATEITLAPNLDYEAIPDEKMFELVAGIVTELLRLSQGELESTNIKIHIGPLDKPYLSVFAKYFTGAGFNSAIEGNWLVIRKKVTT